MKKKAIAILDEYITGSNNNYSEVITKIDKIYIHQGGGLSDFYIWKNDETERISINKPINQVGNQLWEMLRDG